MQIWIVVTWRQYQDEDGSSQQVWWEELAVIAGNREEAITKVKLTIMNGKTNSMLTDTCTAEELKNPTQYHTITIIP
jgi:primosomal replication protein N